MTSLAAGLLVVVVGYVALCVALGWIVYGLTAWADRWREHRKRTKN